MDAGGRAPTVGALGDAGAVAESFRDWVPKLELGNQRNIGSDTNAINFVHMLRFNS
jgi:hypothetical protein